MALALIDLPALRQIEDINRLPNRDTIVLHNDAMLAFIEISEIQLAYLSGNITANMANENIRKAALRIEENKKDVSMTKIITYTGSSLTAGFSWTIFWPHWQTLQNTMTLAVDSYMSLLKTNPVSGLKTAADLLGPELQHCITNGGVLCVLSETFSEKWVYFSDVIHSMMKNLGLSSPQPIFNEIAKLQSVEIPIIDQGIISSSLDSVWSATTRASAKMFNALVLTNEKLHGNPSKQTLEIIQTHAKHIQETSSNLLDYFTYMIAGFTILCFLIWFYRKLDKKSIMKKREQLENDVRKQMEQHALGYEPEFHLRKVKQSKCRSCSKRSTRGKKL